MNVFWKRKKHEYDDQAVELLAASTLKVLKDPRTLPSPKPPPQQWHLRALLGLKSLCMSVSATWKKRPAEKTIAVHQNRRIAMIHCLVHVIPLSVAMTLIGLSLSNRRLSSTIGAELPTILQFAAKLHELTMIASLATTLLSIICYFILRQDGLPFGVAFANLQALQLSYIWSPELLGTLRSKSFKWQYRFYLVMVAVLFALLVSTVGPSSAACMIPRHRRWRVRSWELAAATNAKLFPASLDASSYRIAESYHTLASPGSPSSSDYELLSRMLTNLSRDYKPEYTSSVDGWSQDGIDDNIHLEGPWSAQVPQFPLVLSLGLSGRLGELALDTASMPSTVAAQRVQYSFPQGPATTQYEWSGSMDASSSVQCLPDNRMSFDWSLPPPSLNFSNSPGQLDEARISSDDSKSIRSGFEDVLPAALRSSSTWIDSADLVSTSCTSECDQSVEYSDIYFVQRSQGRGFGAVLAALSYAIEADSQHMIYTVSLLPCTFELRWLPVVSQFTLDGFSSRKYPSSNRDQAKMINASKDWLDLVKPNHPPNSRNASAFSTMFYSSFNRPAVAIATLLTVALSRSVQPGIDVYENSTDANDPDLIFEMEEHHWGYGWSTNSLSVRISLAILILYCLIAIGHIAYSIWTGISSTAWDSISEALALALNSPSPAEMVHSSAGVRNAEAFEHRVRVAVVKDSQSADESSIGHRLALVFPSDEGLIAGNVRVNTAYGT